MPYTTHGWWYGHGEPTRPGPRLVAKCGGLHLCPECALEAHHEESEASMTPPTPTPTQPATSDDRAPRVGDWVMYVSAMTGGMFHGKPGQPRPALVTEVHLEQSHRVGLAIFHPLGSEYRPLDHGGSDYHADGTTLGTWHWRSA